jgi:hypothetical protein
VVQARLNRLDLLDPDLKSGSNPALDPDDLELVPSPGAVLDPEYLAAKV